LGLVFYGIAVVVCMDLTPISAHSDTCDQHVGGIATALPGAAP